MSFEEPSPSTQPDGQPERFLEAVAAPLVNHTEIQFAARHALGSMLTGIGSLDAATEALKRNPRRWKKWLGRSSFAAVILAAWGHAGWQAWEFHQFEELRNDFGPTWHAEPAVKRLTSHLSPHQLLIILGDPQAPKGFRWKALGDRFPDNPSYYARHAICHLNELGTLPEDFDATVARIDPDNGWFLCLKALSIGKDSVGWTSSSTRKTPGKYTIKDQARLDEALALIHRATVAVKFDSYSKKLAEEWETIPLPRRDLLEAVQSSTLLALMSDFGVLRTYEFNNYFLAETQRLTDANQPNQLVVLIHDWKKIFRRFASEKTNYAINSIVIRVAITSGASSIKQASDTCGLTDESNQVQKITDWKDLETKRRRFSPGRADPQAENAGFWVNESVSHIASICPEWSSPPDEILKPGRRADHAVLGRATMLALSVILPLLAGFLALYRFRHGKLIRLLSFSLLRLFRGSDFAWIISSGLVLPLAWHLIVRHSPWGLLDKGVMADLQTVSGPQAVGLLFTILMATSLAARWRVMRRGAMLDLGLCRPWFTWLCLILTAMTMPLMHLWSGNSGWDEKSLLIPLAIPALWLLVMLTRGLFGSGDDALGQALVARASGRALLFGMTLAVVAMGGHYAEERHWVARDPLFQNGATLFPFEGEVSSLMNKQNLELLDMLKVEK